MNENIFLRPRLIGARFDGHGIPLEFLRDLAALEEMIFEVAKWKFLQEHSTRKRVPRKFTEGIELKLTAIDEGSVIPVICLFITSLSTVPPLGQEYFQKSRDTIVSAIGAAEHNQQITNYLPDNALCYFDRIGRSLRSGEAIEFLTPGQTTPVRLTKETRLKLVLASESVREYTEDTCVIGTIPEADQDAMTFEMQLLDGRKIRSPFTEQHRETVLDAFIGFKNGCRVQIQGIGKYSRKRSLQGFESIEHILVLEPLDVRARLQELQLLKDGWLDGQGEALNPIELDWLANAFLSLFPDDLPYPYIYPTITGGVTAEWSLENSEIVLEIDLATHQGKLYIVSPDPSQNASEEVNLDEEVDWTKFVEHLRHLSTDLA